MAIDRAPLNVNRRRFMQGATLMTASGGLGSLAFGQGCPVKDGTVRDRIWIFANPVNGDYEFVRKRSVMSPLEAAVYMGAPNLLMVNQYPGKGQEGIYKAWEPPYEQYAYPLKVLKRVAWSVVGSGGFTAPEETKEVLQMAHTLPNFAGPNATVPVLPVSVLPLTGSARSLSKGQ